MARSGHESVLVVGLGRFGSTVAATLERLGHEVLAVDVDENLVQEWAGHLTHVVRADATSGDVLQQIGAGDFERAVVAIGTDIEASLLSVSALIDLGVRDIWAKAISVTHARILERVGAHHLVRPEHDMGERMAHLLSGRMIDFIELDDGFAIIKTRAPREAWDHTLAEAAIRSRYGVTIVGVKRPREDFTYALPETRVYQDDLLIVAGRTDLCEKFAALT